MPGAPVGSIMEVQVLYQANEQTLELVRHYRVGTQSGQLDPIADEGAVLNLLTAGGTFDIVTPLANCLAADVTVQSIRTQYVYPTRYRALLGSIVLSGSRTGSCTAQNVQGSITFRTNLAGRSQVGGARIGGLSDQDYDGGELVLGLQTAMVTLENALLRQVAEDLGPGLWNACIWHRGKTGTDAYSDITNANVQSQLRTMRRRTVGRGI